MVSLRRVSPMLSSPILAIICAFFFFSSTALAASAVLGVDLGTEYIKAALVKPGIPLEIVLTKDSRRKEMSAVTFKPAKKIEAGAFPERLYGSDAVALSARFPGDVYPNLKTLLGLPADNTLVKEWASRHPALQLEKDKTRGTAAFKSGAFTADEESWTVEEILAMELQSIQKNAEALAGKGSTVKDLVITIPPFYTAEEKRAVILAAELAGLRVLELVSDGLAVGLNYATTRTFPSINEGGAPEYHLVFDMGAGSTKATILKFQGRTVKDIGKFNKTIQEVVVLGSGWDRTLGGDALNAIIVDDMVAKFVETPAAQKASITTEAVKGHGRAVAKLWKEAERLRQVLSANANTQASFEGLYEDIDFKYKLTRAEFEKMAEGHTARIGETIEKALAAADHMEPAQLDSIILHGGAVRTPFVQKELEKFIGKAEKVRSNVNSDEAAVFGAGFRGATLSPSFRVKEIRALEAANYAAGIKWINLHDKPQHQRLWQPASILGSEKQYSFKNQKEFDILFYQHVPSSENISPGSAEKELLKITTTNLTDSVNHVKDKFNCENKDINLKLSTRLSPTTGEVEILKFFVECELEETEEAGSVMDGVKGLFGFGKKDQVPLAEGEEGLETETISTSDSSTSTSTSSKSTTSSSKSSASASASASAKDSKAAKDQKIKKRIIEVNVKYDREIRGTPQLPKAELARMKDRISAFEDSDRSQKLREEALNQLEGFTYRARDLLDNEEFIAASTEAERASLEAKSKEASDWIYSGGADASREELKARLNAMKDIVSPIEVRRDEAAARPAELKKLHDALNQTKSFIEGVKGQIKDDEEKASSFSASKAAASTETPSPSASVEDDFAGLEDDDATTTSSSVASEPTLDPPTYTVEDLKAPQALYDSVSIWLEEKLAAQEKLPPTADPVIFVKDISIKAKQLQDAGVELLMKSMKKPKPSTKKPTSSKKAKTTKSKSKKSAKGESTSTVSGDKAKKTPDFEKMKFGDSDIPIFKVGEDGDMPLEEEILAAMDAQKAKVAEDEKKAKAADEEKKPIEEAKKEKKDKEEKKEHVIDEL